MTDQRFLQLMQKLAKTHKEYTRLLLMAEEEYFQRMGKDASEDDSWVDTFHVGAKKSQTNDNRYEQFLG